MSFLKSLFQPAINLAAWSVARFQGESGADKVKAYFETGIAKELATAVPIIKSDIDQIVPGLAAIADASIDFVRAKFVALVSNVQLSDTAAGRIVSAINAVAAPVAENAVNNLILTFADDVKAALAKL